MLDKIFLEICNMSVTASFIILAVIFIRLLLKKSHKIFSYALWAVVLVRLLSPFTFESTFSIFNITNSITNTVFNTATDITRPFTSEFVTFPETTTVTQFANSTVVETALERPPFEVIYPTIWLIGIAVMVIYSVISLVKLRRKLIGSTPHEKNIYIADNIDSPFVMGFIRPKIYLPSNLSEFEREFIIKHEQTHIKRLDHITRILGFIALSIHWFNPLVWLAFVLSSKDMEISCDECVMKKMNNDIRADYSMALLKFATGRKLVHATPLAFGEGDTKERVKNVMKYKKPVVWVSIALAVITVILLVVFGTNEEDKLNPINNQDNTTIIGKFESFKAGTAKKDVREVFGVPDTYGNWGYDEIYLLENAQVTVSYNSDSETDAFVENVEVNTHARLSLDDIIKLSQKGEDLTWADFEKFPYIRTGSGLHIRVYDINELFTFAIGGGATDDKPIYMKLSAKTEAKQFIDIRTDDVTEFISKYGMDTSDNATLNDLIPMVMVNDKMYIDTGKESQTINRDDYFDGEITSEVAGNKRPTQNNESNFGTGFHYQIIDENVIEIEIDNKWYIFELGDGYSVADGEQNAVEIVGDPRLLTEEELAFFNDNYFDILYEKEGYHIRFSEGTRMGDEVQLVYRGYDPETGDIYEMIEHIVTMQQEG